MVWQLAEAKNRLSEVVNRALNEGPQRITRRDDVVLLISESEYERILGKQTTFLEHLRSVSLEGLAIERENSTMRDADL